MNKELKVKKARTKKATTPTNKKPKFIDGKHVLARELAEKLGLSERQIRRLAGDGILLTEETQSGPRYLLVESLVNYVKHLKGNEEKASITQRKETAEARIKEIRAEKDEIELSIIRGEVHRAEHIEEIFGYTITELRSQLLAMPSRCAIDLINVTAVEASGVLKKAINEVLTYMSHLTYDPAKFAEKVKEDGDIILSSDDEDLDA